MISFKIILGILFGLLVTGITFLGVVSFEYYEVSVATANSIDHTYRVIDKSEEISSSYKDLQLESNGIFVSGDSNLVKPYQDSRQRVIDQLYDLYELTSDNQTQVHRVDSLKATLYRLMSFTDSVLVISSGAPSSLSGLQRRFHENEKFRSEIRRIIFEIKQGERALLTARKVSYGQSNAAFRDAFTQLIGGIALLLGSTFFTIRYNFNNRVKAEDALRHAEDELKIALSSEIELSKMKSNLVTLASHEFRTPLTAIVSSACLIEKYASAEHQDKILRHLARIKSSVANLTSILDEFLSITKIEEGKIVPNLEQTNVKECIEATCSNLRAFVKRDQSISYSHKGEEHVMTDPVLLANIISNLVFNAIKYSPENASICVKSVVGEEFYLSVKDSGIGIPKVDQKHIFNRFYRASNAGAVQGTGLGLNIMKSYVEMLHGVIKLESDEGKGTEVEVTFGHGVAGSPTGFVSPR